MKIKEIFKWAIHNGIMASSKETMEKVLDQAVKHTKLRIREVMPKTKNYKKRSRYTSDFQDQHNHGYICGFKQYKSDMDKVVDKV